MSNHDQHHDHDHGHDHDRGFSHDLPKLLQQGMERRRLFGLVGGLAAAGTLAACGTDASTTTSSTGRSGGSAPGAASATTVAEGEIPEETAGPFPADGSNGPNLLTDGAVVRRDITSSIGDLSGTATGIPTTVELTVVGEADGVIDGEQLGATFAVWGPRSGVA